MLDEILVAGVRPLCSHSATVLCAEFAELSALDVAAVGYGDDHIVVGIEVLGVEVACGIVDVGAARLAVLVADLDKFVPYDGTAH